MSESQQPELVSNTIKETADRLEEYQTDLKSTLEDAKRVRMSILRKIQESPGNEKVLLDNIVIYTNLDRVICDMEKDLDDVDLQLLEQGYHYDIVTWYKAMKGRTMDLCTLTSGISGIGAGFTYATIFSATRGSIALMSWAFVFFLTGFLLPTAIQVVFTCMTTVAFPPGILKSRYSHRVFKMLGVFLVLTPISGALFTAVAIFLTLLSMYGIQYSPVVSGASADVFFTNLVWIACLAGIIWSASYVLMLVFPIVILVFYNLGKSEPLALQAILGGPQVN